MIPHLINLIIKSPRTEEYLLYAYISATEFQGVSKQQEHVTRIKFIIN